MLRSAAARPALSPVPYEAIAASRSVADGVAPVFSKKRVYVVSGQLPLRELGEEFNAGHEVFEIALAIGVQPLLESRFTNYDALAYLALVSEKDRIARITLKVPERGFVRADD